MSLCGKRQPNGVHRCCRDAEHRGTHWVITDTDIGIQWPNRADKEPTRTARSPIKRGSKPKPVSDTQAIRNAFLAGVKAQRLLLSGETCELCGLYASQLDLHHHEKRSRGKGYDGKTFGVDDPGNLMLVCSGFEGSCHSKEHGEPQWGQGSAVESREKE